MTLPSWTPYPGYTKLSLKQIQDEFGCTIIVPTPEIEIERPPLTLPSYPPLPVSIGSVAITPSSFDETTNKVGTVTYTIVNRRGLTLYAFIHHITTNADDFVGATKWTITADSGSFTFTIKTDAITELSTERFQIVISIDETYDGGFYVSNELNILDTSTYPRYNPRILPVSDATGSYITTTNTAITINVADAAPNSTFTAKKTFRAFDNFPVAAPWTPNPYLISTPQTIAANGTWTDASYIYPVPGTYEYEFNFDNYAPALLENGPNRFYKVTVNLTLGEWKLYPDSTVKIGGFGNFTFKYEAPEKTDLKELSWFVVNPGTTTNYAGLGISPLTRGAAFNIKRQNEVNRIGEFTITTSIVSTNQEFEVVLFSGELNQSTKLVQSVKCTVQVKPIIPDLIVTPSTQTKFYKETNNFTVSGSPDEVVEFVYVNENLTKADYLHYFDYNYDVEHAYTTNKFGDASGKSRLEYANYHYNNNGKAEGRKSNQELKDLEAAITKSTVTLLASQSTVANRGNAVVNFATVSYANNLLPRQTKYKFSFVGNKAENTQITPIYADFLITNELRLFVSGPQTVSFGSQIKVTIYTVGKRKITWTGATTGEAFSDDAGYLLVDIAVGATLQTNTVLNWKFNAVGVTKDVDVPYNCTILETSFLVVDKTAPKAEWQNQLFTNSADNKTYNIKVILGAGNKISNRNIVWVVRADKDNVSASVKTNGGAAQSITFNSSREWPMPYELGAVKAPGTDKLEITSPTSTTTLTINITYQAINESYVYGPTGGTIDASTKEIPVGSEVTFRLTGGFPLSQVSTNWKHTPAAGAVQVSQVTDSDPNQGTVNLNSSGGWNTTNSEVKITYVQPGTYTYSSGFAATGNNISLIINVKKVYTFTVVLEKNNNTMADYMNHETMYAKITGNPGETIRISAPMYTPFIASFGCSAINIPNSQTGQPTTFRGVKGTHMFVEGMDRRTLTQAYPAQPMTAEESNIFYLAFYSDVANDANYKTKPREHYDTYGYNEGRMWPSNNGFPARTVVLDANGEGRINLNGDFNRNIFVSSSHFDRTQNPATSFVVVGGVPQTTGGRGHTMFVYDPNTLALKSKRNYDTYADPFLCNSLAADLRAVATGDLVIINSFDAIAIQWELNRAIIEILGKPAGMSDDAIARYWTWSYADIGIMRAGQITVGYARQPSRLLHWVVDRDVGIITYSTVLPGSAGQYPYLASLNKPQFMVNNSVAPTWWKHPYLDQNSPVFSQAFPYPGVSKYIVSGEYEYKFTVRNSSNASKVLALKVIRNDGNEVIRQSNALNPYTVGTVNNVCPPPEPDPPSGFQWGTGEGDFSDIRLKSNIQRIDIHPLGFGIYEYDIFDRREQGVLAQEVQRVLPGAVTCGPDGYLRVFYDQIGLCRKIISKQ